MPPDGIFLSDNKEFDEILEKTENLVKNYKMLKASVVSHMSNVSDSLNRISNSADYLNQCCVWIRNQIKNVSDPQTIEDQIAAVDLKENCEKFLGCLKVNYQQSDEFINNFGIAESLKDIAFRLDEKCVRLELQLKENQEIDNCYYNIVKHLDVLGRKTSNKSNETPQQQPDEVTSSSSTSKATRRSKSLRPPVSSASNTPTGPSTRSTSKGEAHEVIIELCNQDEVEDEEVDKDKDNKSYLFLLPSRNDSNLHQSSEETEFQEDFIANCLNTVSNNRKTDSNKYNSKTKNSNDNMLEDSENRGNNSSSSSRSDGWINYRSQEKNKRINSSSSSSNPQHKGTKGSLSLSHIDAALGNYAPHTSNSEDEMNGGHFVNDVEENVATGRGRDTRRMVVDKRNQSTQFNDSDAEWGDTSNSNNSSCHNSRTLRLNTTSTSSNTKASNISAGSRATGGGGSTSSNKNNNRKRASGSSGGVSFDYNYIDDMFEAAVASTETHSLHIPISRSSSGSDITTEFSLDSKSIYNKQQYENDDSHNIAKNSLSDLEHHNFEHVNKKTKDELGNKKNCIRQHKNNKNDDDDVPKINAEEIKSFRNEVISNRFSYAGECEISKVNINSKSPAIIDLLA